MLPAQCVPSLGENLARRVASAKFEDFEESSDCGSLRLRLALQEEPLDFAKSGKVYFRFNSSIFAMNSYMYRHCIGSCKNTRHSYAIPS